MKITPEFIIGMFCGSLAILIPFCSAVYDSHKVNEKVPVEVPNVIFKTSDLFQDHLFQDPCRNNFFVLTDIENNQQYIVGIRSGHMVIIPRLPKKELIK